MKPGQTPPRLFHRFFRWYCHPKLLDHIEGDLLELYNERVNKKGRRKANVQFIIDVLLLFRPGIISTAGRYKNINRYGMFRSYFTIGWRRLLRNKGYSFINIGGLSIGMTVALFIGLWIYDELSFNKYHKNYDDIAQVWSGSTDPKTATIDGSFSLQYPAGPVLKNNYPHYFKQVLMARGVGDFTLLSANDKFNRKGEFIEAGALEMLSLKMLKGSYKSLDKPHSIILSKSTSLSIFGNEDPMNKTLKIDNRMDVEVTGIYEDIPRNNRFSEVQFFSPWALWVLGNDWVKRRENDWDNRPFTIYVQLQPNITVQSANAAIKDLYYKNVPGDLLKTMDKNKPFVQLIPMSTWHLYSEFKNGIPAEGRITFVWLFGMIGFFVLLLACINFINLSTARSEKRAREVGVRKAIGSGKRQLIAQFLSESFIVVLFAFMLSVVSLVVLQNWFNQIADKDILLPFGHPVFWLMAIAFILLTGFMAGIYPAFYLSSFQPVKVLKGAIRSGRLATLPRKVLVVVQFTVSVVLIIGTLIIYQQIRFAQNRPIGYDRKNLITVTLNDPGFKDKQEVLKTELLATGVVSSLSISSNPLTAVWNVTSGYNWQGKDPGFDAEFANCKVTYDFGKTVGWEFAVGRDFSRDFLTDSADAIIINETAAKYMGLKNPVGQKFTDVDALGRFKWSRTIIGVVKDMVMESPYEPVKQTIFYFGDIPSGLLHIKISPMISTATALQKIKTAVEKVVPSALFDYKFVDEQYARKFSQEERIGKLAGIFSILAIFISCLGLFGLASFVAEQRTKEIGIRKVMGATVSNVWQLLSKDFVILVVISCLIAIPIGYFLMHHWLQQYAYRTEISWWIFLLTGIVAVVITILTVSYQSIKAAMSNPVKSLRSE